MEVFRGFVCPIQRRCAHGGIKFVVRMHSEVILSAKPMYSSCPPIFPSNTLYATFVKYPTLSLSLSLWDFSNSFSPQKIPSIPETSLLSRTEDKSFFRDLDALPYLEKYIHFLPKYMYTNIYIYLNIIQNTCLCISISILSEFTITIQVKNMPRTSNLVGSFYWI